jgi:probable F420-dependent oxidoreductase
MTSHPFRFGVSLMDTSDRTAWQATARQAEDLGYDVLAVPDHLGMLAPFPTLVAAGEVTNMRLGTYVLNAGFYSPALLARDVAETDRLLGGRLELGLGAGYNPAEFEAAGLPFHSGGKRIDHLAHTVTELRKQVDPMPTVMLAGNGDRMLRLAAQEADIVGFTITSADGDPAQRLADRDGFVRTAAGDRFDSLELNLFVFSISVTTGEPDLTVARRILGQTDEQIRSLPGVLIGSEQQIADTLLRYRDELGISYFGVLEPDLVDFAKVISLLR